MINLPRCPIELRHRIDSHYGAEFGDCNMGPVNICIQRSAISWFNHATA